MDGFFRSFGRFQTNYHREKAKQDNHRITQKNNGSIASNFIRPVNF